jgi:hypothetical protein
LVNVKAEQAQDIVDARRQLRATPMETTTFRDLTGAIHLVVTNAAREAPDCSMCHSGVRRLTSRGRSHTVWRNLPDTIPAFDYSSISDVIVYVRYTVRESGYLAGPAAQSILDEIASVRTAHIACLRERTVPTSGTPSALPWMASEASSI